MNFKRNTPRKLSDEMSKEYTINPGNIAIKFSALEDRIIRVTDKVTDKLDKTSINIVSYPRIKLLGFLLH